MKTKILYLVMLTVLFFQVGIKAQQRFDLKINFPHGSCKLSGAQVKSLDSVKLLMAADRRDYLVVIVGHTDSIGNPVANQNMSYKRALACKKVLIQKGIPEKNISIMGKGASVPLQNNISEAGRAANRRVEIIVDSRGKLGKNRTIDDLSQITSQQRYRVNAQKGGGFVFASGTSLVFGPNSFADKNGNIIQGDVDVSYLELRDPIDIALSDINMVHEHGSEQMLFNSAGMFRLLASQNNQAVFVSNRANIQVNFRMTQNIPGLDFYSYDSVNRSWVVRSGVTAGGIAATGSGVVNSFGNVFTNSNSYCSSPEYQAFVSCIDDGLNCINNKIKLLPRIIEVDSFYNSGIFRRYDSAAKALSELQMQLNKVNNEFILESHTYRVKWLNTADSVWKFTIKSKGRYFNELENFSKVIFSYSLTPKSPAKKGLAGITFTLCEFTANNGRYDILLKHSNGSVALNGVELSASHEIARSERDTYLRALASQRDTRYQNYVGRREQQLSEIRELSRKIEFSRFSLGQLLDEKNSVMRYNRREVIDTLMCFWNLQKLFMPAVEKQMGFKQWIAFFDDNHDTMKHRLLTAKNSDRYRNCLIKVEEYRLFLLELEKSRKLCQQRDSLVANLQIRNFGICNIDALMRYNFVCNAVVAIENENRKTINVASVKMIDATINSAVSFSEKNDKNQLKIAFNPKSETALLVFDADNNLYVCGKKTFSKKAAGSTGQNLSVRAVSVKNRSDKRSIQLLLEQ